MKLEALIQNMTDQIKEAQLKLGYARETMRLYYPLSSLNAMLEMQETDIRELAKKIRHELEAKKEKMPLPTDSDSSDEPPDPSHRSHLRRSAKNNKSILILFLHVFLSTRFLIAKM